MHLSFTLKQQAFKRAQAAVKSSQVEEKTQDDQKSPASNQNYEVVQAPVEPVKPVEEAQVVKKTYEQWKNEIFTAQNKETILKLVAAYRKGDVTAENFQKLATEMLASKDDKMVGLGLYASWAI